MFRVVCYWTTLLVLPFGLAALIVPGILFGQFGMTLDAAAQGVARGYGATALGLGVTAFRLRYTVDPAVQVAVLNGILVFNLAELMTLVTLRLQDEVNLQSYGMIIGHMVGSVLTLLALQRTRPRFRHA